MNIVTSIYVDNNNNSKSLYPHVSKDEAKRKIYWQCALTFFLTSIKLNKKAKHIVFTNDRENIIIDGYNIKEELSKLGVQIIQMAFDKFDPKEYSSYFRNSFYKLEVINELGEIKGSSILVDSDCIFIKEADGIFDLITDKSKVLLQDTYQRSATPILNKPKHLSMANMKEVYDTIDLSFSSGGNDNDYPVWYGGEFIGTSPEQFRLIGKRLKATFDYCFTQFEKGQVINFKNGKGMFDNDEFISSYVFDSLDKECIVEVNGVIIRSLAYFNIKKTDVNLYIWHLPTAKTRELKTLFYEINKEDSEFWNESTNVVKFLGRFFGIPKSNQTIGKRIKREANLFMSKSKKKFKQILN